MNIWPSKRNYLFQCPDNRVWKYLFEEVKVTKRKSNTPRNSWNWYKLCWSKSLGTSFTIETLASIEWLLTIISHEKISTFWNDKITRFILKTSTGIVETSMSEIFPKIRWFIELDKCCRILSRSHKNKTIFNFYCISRSTQDTLYEITLFWSYAWAKYDNIAPFRGRKFECHLIYEDKLSISIVIWANNSTSMKCCLHRWPYNLKWRKNKRTYEKHYDKHKK